MTDAIRRWVLYSRLTLAGRTHIHYRMVIWRFRDFAPQYLKDLKLEHIETYLQSIFDKGFTARTVNSHLTAVKSFCRWASDHYDLPNPAKMKMLNEEPPRRRVLSNEEYHKLLKVCSEQEANVLVFLANTGLRSTEFTSLKPSNVSHDKKYLTIYGKNRKERIIPLNPVCQKIIRKSTINLLKSFTHRNALYAFCKRLSIRADIPIAGPHSFRHFFASRLYDKGVPISFISELLGHSDIRTTQNIYIHFKSKHLLGVTDVLTE